MNKFSQSTNTPQIRDSAVSSSTSSSHLALETTRLRIGQMDCSTEETLIRKKLKELADVHTLKFDLIQRILTVVHIRGSLDKIIIALSALNMTATVLIEHDPNTLEILAAASQSNKKKLWIEIVLAGALAALAEIAHFIQGPTWLIVTLAVASILIGGLNTYQKGWIAIRHGNLNINALMSIAVSGALLIGQWPEAAMVMCLFNIAEWIEARSLARARHAIDSLLNLAPQTASVLQTDGSYNEVIVNQIKPETILRARPGERIAIDGIVTKGYSAIDQSPITGESLPIEKHPGDLVYAGTINTFGVLNYRVTTQASHTVLARMVQTVEHAQSSRAPTERFIDRFSQIYTPCMVGVAILTALIPPMFWSEDWLIAIYRALGLLIIACPCALVLSTPVTIVSALTAAARQGILIKGGVYLEAGRKLQWLALDKTGTLTQGHPMPTDSQDWETVADSDLIMVSLASHSDHPISAALTRTTPLTKLLEVKNISALPGRGIKGEIQNQIYYLGNYRLMSELKIDHPKLASHFDLLESQGKTVIALSDGQRVLKVVALMDTLKPSSQAAIQALRQLGIRMLILSGDNPQTVQTIAQQMGIDQAYGNQLPEDKLMAIEEKLKTSKVGMVGDGINDALALARATVGFAMGKMGSDMTIETADVTLMDDDLNQLVDFIHLSRKTYHVFVQNITIALGIKIVFLALMLNNEATLWMAIFADVGASLIVVANGLRLLRAVKPHRLV